MLVDAPERRGEPAGGLGVQTRQAAAVGLDERVDQFLERVVVQVARDAAALRLADLAEPLLRSTAPASTLATACTKLTSDAANVRPLVECAASTPKGSSGLSI